MLVRPVDQGVISITQPAHAWLSGQIARQWGNEVFGAVAPWEEVCTGATHHDVGWIEWERSPTLNPETGWPHTFLQLPVRTHLAIWSGASRRALVYGRYPALLTSLHFSGLYANRDSSRMTEEDAQSLRDLLSSERDFQRSIIESLRSDPVIAPHATDEVIERNRRLVAIWDGMSLAICHGLKEPREFTSVPTSTGATSVTLAPSGDDITVEPWPFARDEVESRVDGRILEGRFTDEDALREALEVAEWTTVVARLLPVTGRT